MQTPLTSQVEVRLDPIHGGGSGETVASAETAVRAVGATGRAMGGATAADETGNAAVAVGAELRRICALAESRGVGIKASFKHFDAR